MAQMTRHPLQELREALGLKPAELAERIGRTRAFVAMVEGGHSDMGRESVIALFDAFRDELNRLGITAEDLLRGTRERFTDGDGSAEAVA